MWVIDCLRKARVYAFNKKNKTNIKSLRASLYAAYGKNILIGNKTCVTEDVEIGDYSYINDNSYVENCIIGKFCSISSGVYICPYEHQLGNFSTSPLFEDKGVAKRKKVIIGNDVLISLNAIILSGVSIGNGAVIAAGAVVTKDVSPYEVVGGVPAKNIGWRMPEDKRKELLQSCWWNKSIADIYNMKDKLNNK